MRDHWVTHPSHFTAMKQSKNEREVSRLTRELQKERQTSARLRREVADLHRELEWRHTPAEPAPLLRRRKARTPEQARAALLAEAASNATRFRTRTYLGFLTKIVKGSSLFGFVSQVVAYMRRLQVVRIVATVLTVILTTAVVSAVYVAALPFLITGAAAGLLVARLTSRSMNRIMRRELAGRRVRVFVAPDRLSLNRDSMYLRNLRAMAEENVAIILVSPSAFSGRGLGGRGPYFTARREAHDLYIVRKHYYFMLRRHVLDSVCQSVTVVY